MPISTGRFPAPTSSGPTAACGRSMTTAPRSFGGDARLRAEGRRARRRTGPERAPVLSIFGGKITTYRKLAEHALARARAVLSADEARLDAQRAVARAATCRPRSQCVARRAVRRYPQLPAPLLRALADRHGSRAVRILGDAQSTADLGEDFGAELTAREIDYLIAEEWATHRRRRALAADQMRPADDAGATRCRRRRLATLAYEKLCLFCGSNVGARPAYAQAAGDFGRAFAARGTHARLWRRQRRTDADRRAGRAGCGRQVIGVITEQLMVREVGHPGLTELRVVARCTSARR